VVIKLQFIEGYIIFSLKEAEALCQMWERLKQNTWKDYVKPMTEIVAQLRKDRTISGERWLLYMNWRKTKGTVYASPVYQRIIFYYFKKMTCPNCRGKGHEINMDVCHLCHGSGGNLVLKKLLRLT
jgi:hypothetical protein